MYNKFTLLMTIIAISAIPLLLPDAFGHGLGGDQAEPISFGNMEMRIYIEECPSNPAKKTN